MPNITPVIDKILIKPVKQVSSQKGIVLPEDFSENNIAQGTVVAIPESGMVLTDRGAKIEVNLPLFSLVYFRKDREDLIRVDEEEYYLLPYHKILAEING